jgi:hypothetical protein
MNSYHFDRGVEAGYEAANFRNAYGVQPGEEKEVSEEAKRRAAEKYGTSGPDRAPRDDWAAGFVIGWSRYEANEWSDGTPRED